MNFMKAIRIFLLYWLPAILWMCFIFALSSRQRISVGDSYAQNFAIFKTLHLIEYSTLYVLLFRAFYKSLHKKIKLKYIFAFAVASAILYAATDEFHQTFTPTRQGSIRDIGIDSIGIFFAFSYTKIYLSKLKRFI